MLNVILKTTSYKHSTHCPMSALIFCLTGQLFLLDKTLQDIHKYWHRIFLQDRQPS